MDIRVEEGSMINKQHHPLASVAAAYLIISAGMLLFLVLFIWMGGVWSETKRRLLACWPAADMVRRLVGRGRTQQPTRTQAFHYYFNHSVYVYVSFTWEHVVVVISYVRRSEYAAQLVSVCLCQDCC